MMAYKTNKPARFVKIHGIPTRLRLPATRQALAQVLARIKARCPKDFARLRKNVVIILPLPRRDAKDGTCGQWKPNQVYGFVDPDYGDASGKMLINEDEKDHMIATIVHELGHACTTAEVFDRRRCTTDEWSSELAADWYAYRWGFAREIRRSAAARSFIHHGALPGGTIEEASGGTTRRYRITRSFVMRMVKEYPTPPNYLEKILTGLNRPT